MFYMHTDNKTVVCGVHNYWRLIIRNCGRVVPLSQSKLVCPHERKDEGSQPVLVANIFFKRVEYGLRLPDMYHQTDQMTSLKQNLNASRPSEHPPVRGENVKTFGWDHRHCEYKPLGI